MRDSTGYSVSDRLRRCGELCQKAGELQQIYGRSSRQVSEYADKAYDELDHALNTLETKGRCLNCISGMKEAKRKLASM